MKVTLSFEATSSSDVSIMVDVLRASTTITAALDNFKRVIPCFSPEEALILKEKTNGVMAGERLGKTLEGFDIGNSPCEVKNFKNNSDTLILTTSNGTRILENMDSTVLVGSFINAQSVANAGLKIAEEHIDVVMAGVRGEFALEDFLAAGEILYWIDQNCNECELSEYAQSAILASRDWEAVKKAFYNTRTANRLIELGFENDVKFCLSRNISDNVAIYGNNELTLYI